uniref:Uncharacterized protein n=1 Tax=Siphoviridae sp. ctio73 TaxID=2826435 RepID=A0A8S5MXK1_9CAUD|nr:MAG TPA: hypothetical protein [Siphoviridae sp. ctio73]
MILPRYSVFRMGCRGIVGKIQNKHNPPTFVKQF